MAFDWNEIKDYALTFSKEWAKAKFEDVDTKPFWMPATPIKKPRKPRP